MITSVILFVINIVFLFYYIRNEACVCAIFQALVCSFLFASLMLQIQNEFVKSAYNAGKNAESLNDIVNHDIIFRPYFEMGYRDAHQK